MRHLHEQTDGYRLLQGHVPQEAHPRPQEKVTLTKPRAGSHVPMQIHGQHAIPMQGSYTPSALARLTSSSRGLLGREIRHALHGHGSCASHSRRLVAPHHSAYGACPTSLRSVDFLRENSLTGSGSRTSTPTIGSSNPTSSAWPPMRTAASPPPNLTSRARLTSTACQTSAATASYNPKQVHRSGLLPFHCALLDFSRTQRVDPWE